MHHSMISGLQSPQCTSQNLRRGLGVEDFPAPPSQMILSVIS